MTQRASRKQMGRSQPVNIASSRFTLPSAGKWSGIFPGEFFGNIYSSKNVDLTRQPKKVSIADSATAITTSVSLGNLTTPTAFLRTAADSTDRYWALGGRLFKTTGTNPEGTWAQDAIANTPTAPLYDLIEYSSAMYVPVDTNIYRLAAGTWTVNWWTVTAGGSALTTAKPHRFFIQAGALCFTDGPYVHTWDGTIATQQALILPTQFQAQFGISGPDVAYIGTKSLNAGNAEVFAWDRSNQTYSARYDSGDSEVLAGFLGQGMPYIITKQGYIKRFTGQGFQTVAQFPSVEARTTITNIDPNGVSVDGNKVMIFVDFGVIANLRLRSGYWVYEIDTNNLYHSGSIKNNVNKDYAQLEVAAAGAIKQTLPGSGRYLIGGRAYTAYSGSSVYGIYSLDEAATTGQPAYIITPKMKGGNVRRFWRQLFLRFPNFQSANDRLRVAYAVLDSTTLPAYETITWVNSTSFTGANANAAIGDFVEILAGDNAGALAKITNKTGGPTYTFTIDLTLSASTLTARATYLKFIDLGTVSAQGIQEAVFRPLARSTWIQFLIELRGGITTPALEEAIVDGSELPS